VHVQELIYSQTKVEKKTVGTVSYLAKIFLRYEIPIVDFLQKNCINDISKILTIS
jgi:hypothetical protein